MLIGTLQCGSDYGCVKGHASTPCTAVFYYDIILRDFFLVPFAFVGNEYCTFNVPGRKVILVI
jgi:hypothetical protein